MKSDEHTKEKSKRNAEQLNRESQKGKSINQKSKQIGTGTKNQTGENNCKKGS